MGLNAYTKWVVGTALPFWSTTGFDEVRGRFFERLDWTGQPVLSAPHRAMVQARQIYVFAHAALLGWFPGGRVAEIAMASLLRDFQDKSSRSAGLAFSVSVDGVIVSDVRDAYTHAFVLFAIAWLYRLNGDTQLLVVADEVIGFIDARLEDPVNAGLFDMFPVTDQCKRQNPHMHLLEAYLALEAAAPGRGYLERAKKLIGILKTYLYNAEKRVLLEYFAADWSEHPDPAKSHVFEPGHHFEWVWLLHEYEKVSAEDLGFWITQLDESARYNGLTEEGLIFDEVSADMQVCKQSHRIWPHTEAMKAAVARYSKGDQDATHFADLMARSLMENFLDKPFSGGWIDHILADRQPLVTFVPASSLYHLFLAASELARGFRMEVRPA